MPGAVSDWRVYNLRRLLLVADVLAFVAGFSASGLYDVAIGGGSVRPADVVRLVAGLPVWLLFTHAFSLYHTESRRADHGLAEEIGPILQMTTLWIWTMALATTVIDSSRYLDITELAVFWVTAIVSMVVARLHGRGHDAAPGMSRTRWIRRACGCDGEQGPAAPRVRDRDRGLRRSSTGEPRRPSRRRRTACLGECRSSMVRKVSTGCSATSM